MAFDLKSAKPISGFDINTAKPIQEPSIAEQATSLVNKIPSPFNLPTSFKDIVPGGNQIAEVGNAANAVDKTYPLQHALPAAGAGIGGLLGVGMTLPSGALVPFGETIGAGAGGYIGSLADQGISALRGQPFPQTALESQKKAGIEGLVDGATQLAGSGITKAYTPILEGISTPAKEAVVSLAEKYGIKLPVQTRLAQEGMVREVNKLSKTVGGGALKEQTAEAADGLQNLFRDTIHEVSGGKDIPNGKSILQDTPQKYFDIVQKKSSDLFDQIPKDSPASNISETASTIDNIFKENQNLNITDKSLANKIKSFQAEIDHNPNLSYGDLKEFRSYLGRKTDFSSSDLENGIKKKIYNSLTEDMVKSAEEGGFKDLASKANQSWKDFKNSVQLHDVLDSSIIRNEFNPRILANRLDNIPNETIIERFGKKVGQKIIDTKTIANTLSNQPSAPVFNPLSIPYLIPRKVGSEILANRGVQNAIGRGLPIANQFPEAIRTGTKIGLQGARLPFNDKNNP